MVKSTRHFQRIMNERMNTWMIECSLFCFNPMFKSVYFSPKQHPCINHTHTHTKKEKKKKQEEKNKNTFSPNNQTDQPVEQTTAITYCYISFNLQNLNRNRSTYKIQWTTVTTNAQGPEKKPKKRRKKRKTNKQNTQPTNQTTTTK